MAEAPVEIVTGNQITGSIIWLHGLGADGHDFEPVVQELRRTGALGVRFLFPHAPIRPITLNGGMLMRGWFDLRDLTGDAPVDETGLQEAEALVAGLIAQEEARGVPPERVVLAGFSQGGATVLYAALRWARPLAGVMGLSCWLPRLPSVPEAPTGAPLPVFMAHGQYDPVVAPELGRATRDRLSAMGHQVVWHEYPMEHAVCMEEIETIDRWLAERLANSP